MPWAQRGFPEPQTETPRGQGPGAPAATRNALRARRKGLDAKQSGLQAGRFGLRAECWRTAREAEWVAGKVGRARAEEKRFARGKQPPAFRRSGFTSHSAVRSAAATCFSLSPCGRGWPKAGRGDLKPSDEVDAPSAIHAG